MMFPHGSADFCCTDRGCPVEPACAGCDLYFEPGEVVNGVCPVCEYIGFAMSIEQGFTGTIRGPR